MTVDISKFVSMPVETLKKELVKEPRSVRKAFFAWFAINRKADAAELRHFLEARRGIKRDEQGRILRSKEWLKERITALEVKADGLQNRLKNVTAELAARKAELKGKK